MDCEHLHWPRSARQDVLWASENDRVQHGAKGLDDIGGHDSIDVLLKMLLRVQLANLMSKHTLFRQNRFIISSEHAVGHTRRTLAISRFAADVLSSSCTALL